MKKGDVVSLKSGGPDMTVVSVSDTEIQCQWFDGPRVMERPFAPETLKVGSAASRLTDAIKDSEKSGNPRKGRSLIHDM